MSSITVGAAVTAIIGLLWIALAVIYHTGDTVNTVDNVTVGVSVAMAGLLTGIAARWWENRE
jgi:hypothetical protein